MHAIILAGGKGVRLRPYTTAFPKPLVPIGDEMAILEVVMRQLAAHGFSGVTIAIGHLGGLIRAYCGDGSQWGVDITYWDESSPLGTIGPIVANLDRCPDNFLVMNGDILTDLDFAAFLSRHVASAAPLTVSTYERTVQVDFGVLEIGGEHDDQIVAFREKPVETFSVSMGVYGLSRATLERYEPGTAVGFDELVLDLIEAGQLPRVEKFAGYWLDIGRPDDYDQANADWPMCRDRFVPPR